MPQIFYRFLALIASVTDRELARYVEFLKTENKFLRSRVPGQIHTKPHEREKLLKFGRPLGRSIEELLTIVSPSTFYSWHLSGRLREPRKVYSAFWIYLRMQYCSSRAAYLQYCGKILLRIDHRCFVRKRCLRFAY